MVLVSWPGTGARSPLSFHTVPDQGLNRRPGDQRPDSDVAVQRRGQFGMRGELAFGDLDGQQVEVEEGKKVDGLKLMVERGWATDAAAQCEMNGK